MTSQSNAVIYLVDDDASPVAMLALSLEDDSSVNARVQWLESLSELLLELGPPATEVCVFVLDSLMSITGVEETVRDAVAAHDPSLVECLDHPELRGLMFASLVRRLRPNGWIILHSAYSERIRHWTQVVPALEKYRRGVIDFEAWKPTELSALRRAVLDGLKRSQEVGRAKS